LNEKLNLKTLKLIGFSIISFVFYFFLENSNKINIIVNQLKEYNHGKGFGYYILFQLFKGFLLIFGIISLSFIGFNLFKKED